MLLTNFTEFFKHVTSSISNYVMCIALILLVYLLAVTFVKIVFTEIARLIITIRVPIVAPSLKKNDETSTPEWP